MKIITFFTFQLIFFFSINSFIYIDLMLELIEETASNSHYFNKVTLSDLTSPVRLFNALLFFRAFFDIYHADILY